MNLTDLENELNELLQECPELMALQMQISTTLATLDDPKDRMYYLATELFDKFDELNVGILDLQDKLRKLI